MLCTSPCLDISKSLFLKDKIWNLALGIGELGAKLSNTIRSNLQHHSASSTRRLLLKPDDNAQADIWVKIIWLNLLIMITMLAPWLLILYGANFAGTYRIISHFTEAFLHQFRWSFQSLCHVSCILVILLTFISIHRNGNLFWWSGT